MTIRIFGHSPTLVKFLRICFSFLSSRCHFFRCLGSLLLPVKTISEYSGGRILSSASL